YSVAFYCCVTDGSRGADGKMTSDVEVCMNWKCVIEFFHAENISSSYSHRCLLNSGCEHTEVVGSMFQAVATEM
ncbi:hypothetical protein ABN236_19280, partial [Proteus sp. fly-1013]|uniref:hypothetical protein n=1 Tax=Proteus sp. fly-1013 TaxID=3136673 RepID=UPI0032D9CBCF